MTVVNTDFAVQFGLLGLLLTLLALLWRRKGKSRTELESLPGPRRYFLGGLLNLLEIRNPKQSLSVFSKWIAGNEPIVRVSAGPISGLWLKSPDYIQKVYGSMDLNHMGKPAIVYNAFKPASWFDGLLTSEGEKWKLRRKLITSLLSYKSLSSYVNPLNENSRRLVESLETKFGKGDNAEPAPIYDLLFNSAVNAVCETVFGADLNETQVQLQYSLQQFTELLKRYLEIISLRILTPWLQLLFPFSRLSVEVRKDLAISKSFVMEMVREHEKLLEGGGIAGGMSGKGQSIIRYFVQAGLGFDAIYEEVMTLLGGGTDTTATTLHFVLFFLALHPKHQDKCRQEVDLLFGDSELHDISKNELKSLVFLEQCICETLRMVPPVFAILRRLKTPVNLDENLELPSGTTVGVFLPAIHMNPEIYPNPEKFLPERFCPKNRKSRHQYSYLPFSGGPRGCVGAKLAMTQVIISSAHVLRHFRFSTPDKFKDIKFLPSVTLTPEHPMKFVFQKRQF